MTTTSPTATRFWSKVTGRESPDGCWLWTAGRSAKGYGIFCRDGRSQQAHRVAYELEVAPIPVGLTLDHLCRNRSCVNPAHLDPVTNRENVLRGEGCMAKHARKTHCPQGHPYSGDNLHVYQGRRYCRACHKVHARAHDLRRKAAA